MFRHTLIAVGMTVLTLAAAAAQALETVTVHAARDGANARIVFDWLQPVGFSAKLLDRRLRVVFDRPMSPDLQDLYKALGNVIASAGMSGDGRSLTIELTQDFALASIAQGNQVVLTLAGAPAASAAEIDQGSPAPSPAGSIAVRVGRHGGFSRIVFDWMQAVEYRVERDGQRVVLDFSRGAALDQNELRAQAAEAVRDITVQAKDQRLGVAFTMPEGARLRHFIWGTKVVVDVIDGPATAKAAPDPATTAAAEAASAAPAPEKPPSPFQPAAVAAVESKAADQPALPAPPAPATENQTAIATVEGPRPAEAPPTPDKPPAQPEQVEQAAQPEQVEQAAPMVDPDSYREPTVPRPRAADVQPGATGQAATVGRPVELVPNLTGGLSESAAAPQLSTSPVAEPAAPLADAEVAANTKGAEPDAAPAATAKLSVENAVNGARLIFDWPDPVAAAVFRRADRLWIVFDSGATIDFAPLAGIADVVGEPHQDNAQGSTVLRFSLGKGLAPSVSRQGTRWTVALEPEADLDTAIAAAWSQEGSGRLQFKGEEAGNRIDLIDPEIGDRLVIVPLAAAGHGLMPGRRFVDFELLPTAQGIVLRPIAEAVEVTVLRDEVEIGSLAGLRALASAGAAPPPSVAVGTQAMAAPDGTEGPTTAVTIAPAPDAVLLDFASWRRQDKMNFRDSLFALNRALALADDHARGAARLDLARFYFANRMPSETLGVLRAVEGEDPATSRAPAVIAMRGVANLLIGRGEQARTDLGDAALAGHPEMDQWRGLLAMDEDDSAAADHAFQSAGLPPAGYPDDLRHDLLLAAAEAALATGDGARGDALLNLLEQRTLSLAHADRVSYLRGRLKLSANSPDDAILLFEKAMASTDRRTSAEAEAALLETRLAQKQIKPADLINRFESLRFAWRGDRFEHDLLRRLGDLYLAGNDFTSALSAYRDLITFYPEGSDAGQVAEAMSKAFTELFVAGGADQLSPVEALALYYDFIELSPTGSEGDKLTQHLADRLAEMDLLADAARMLKRQLAKHPDGPERARIGLRLAEIETRDGHPDKAIETLAASAVADMPAELQLARHYLEIRAIVAGQAYDQALAKLAGDSSPDGLELRAEIYWAMQDWMAEATVLDQILRARVDGQPLSPGESDKVMRMAVALALSNNRVALADLRDRFGDGMDKTDDAEAFRALASFVDGMPVDIAGLAQSFGQPDAFDGLIPSLNRDIAEQGTKAVN